MKSVIIEILAGALAVMLVSGWKGGTAFAADDVKLDLTKGDIEISTDGYRQSGGDLKDGPEDGSYIITSGGKETSHVVTILSGKNHNITFDQVNIRTATGTGCNPLYIAPKAKASLTLKGTNVLYSEGYAGIAVPENATLKIAGQQGATLEARVGAASSGAGIGETQKDNKGNEEKNAGCGTIEVSSGVISTTSIGSAGTTGSAEKGTLSSGSGGTAWIDAGSVNADKKEFVSGVLFDGSEGQVYGSYTLSSEGLMIPAGKTLTIPKGSTMTVSGKYQLLLDGNLVNNGTFKIGSESNLAGNSNLEGEGVFYLSSGFTADMFSVPDKVLYSTGEDHTEYVKKYIQDSIKTGSSGMTIMRGRIFVRMQADDWKMELNPSKVMDKGTYTVTFTDPEDSANQVSKTFEVLDVGEMTGIAVTTPPSKTQYTYGESFNKSGMVVSVTYTSGAVRTVDNSKIQVKDGNLSVGQTAVTLVYQVNGKTLTCTVGIAVSPKEIDVSKINWEEESKTSFEYDGTVKSLDFSADMPEGLKVGIGGVNSATDAGIYTATIDFFLDESYKGNYVLTGNVSQTKEWSITPRQLEWNTGDLEVVGNTRDENVYVYGVLSVEGLLPEDARKENLQTSFPADKLTGIYRGGAAGEEEVALAWADEGDSFTLGNSAEAGNYTFPEELPVVSAVIHDVKITIAPPEIKFGKDAACRLDIESGVSMVPDSLKGNPDYDFPSEIEKGLIETVMKKGIKQTYTNVYDLSLMKQAEHSEWKRISADVDASEGVTVTIPYPRGITQGGYDGIVAYIYPRDLNGTEAGTIVYPEVTKTDKGIQFQIPDPAPVAVGWKKATVSESVWDFWTYLFGGK